MGESRILVLDDETSVRRSVGRALRDHGDVLNASTVCEGAAMLDELSGWIALLIDVRLPDGDGLEFLAWARGKCWAVPALVMTGFLDDRVATAAFDLHATVLPKPFRSERIVEFVTAAKSRAQATQQASDLFAVSNHVPPGERDVLRRLVAGETVAQIAMARSTSEHTVRKQIATLRWRAGATSIHDLVTAILRSSPRN